MVHSQNQRHYIDLAPVLTALTIAFGVLVGVGFYFAPAPKRVCICGVWSSERDTLRFTDELRGTFGPLPFRVTGVRGTHLRLALPRQADGAVLVLDGDSLIMTTGIRTLLHEGDTVRILRRH